MIKLETVNGGGRKNRHPVDRLKEVREDIAALERQERELRDAIVSGECSSIGDDWEAKVMSRSRETIDTVAIKRELGRERLRPFLKQSEFMVVTLKERR